MTLRCKPGDLCVVIASPPQHIEGLVGAFVTVMHTEPCACCGDANWRLEKPVDARILFAGRWHDIWVTAIHDELLQPIRGQQQPEAIVTAEPARNEVSHAGI